MLRESSFPLERFVTLIALKRSFPSMLHNVRSQVTGLYTSVVALVTLFWLFSSVCPNVVRQS